LTFAVLPAAIFTLTAGDAMVLVVAPDACTVKVAVPLAATLPLFFSATWRLIFFPAGSAGRVALQRFAISTNGALTTTDVPETAKLSAVVVSVTTLVAFTSAMRKYVPSSVDVQVNGGSLTLMGLALALSLIFLVMVASCGALPRRVLSGEA